jgi:hypothetical protein
MRVSNCGLWFENLYRQTKVNQSMVEKMTAVWLIILTILVCAAVPGVLIWLTSSTAPARMLIWLEATDSPAKYEIVG